MWNWIWNPQDCKGLYNFAWGNVNVHLFIPEEAPTVIKLMISSQSTLVSQWVCWSYLWDHRWLKGNNITKRPIPVWVLTHKKYIFDDLQSAGQVIITCSCYFYPTVEKGQKETPKFLELPKTYELFTSWGFQALFATRGLISIPPGKNASIQILHNRELLFVWVNKEKLHSVAKT